MFAGSGVIHENLQRKWFGNYLIYFMELFYDSFGGVLVSIERGRYRILGISGNGVLDLFMSLN